MIKKSSPLRLLFPIKPLFLFFCLDLFLCTSSYLIPERRGKECGFYVDIKYNNTKKCQFGITNARNFTIMLHGNSNVKSLTY